MTSAVLCDVLQLSLEQQCEDGVFMLAMNYLDRFLTTTNIRKTQLQLAATVCLLVASKLKQTFPLTTHHLVAYTDYSITIQELVVSKPTHAVLIN